MGAPVGTEPERVETYMSVFMRSILADLGLTSDRVLEGVDNFVLVRLTAQQQARERGSARGAAQQIFPAPENPPPPCKKAHAGIAGKKTKGLRKDFSDLAVWIIRPSIEWVIENRTTLQIPEDFSVETQFDLLFS